MSEQTSGAPSGSIADYELLCVIGRGAYGEVWLARNLTRSFVALKVVRRTAFDHDRPFEREFEGIKHFEPISRLYESQVDILHVGRNDAAGYFYYVMELADSAEDGIISSSRFRGPDGETRNIQLQTYTPHTLKLDLCHRGRLPVDECILIGLALTKALEHLHAHGLVHRDVKPSNIIFVNGMPKLADIGLVASSDATISIVGTSGFFPPEGPGTPQADLYSLGKVLYEISTGRDRQDFPKLPPDLAELTEQRRFLELNAIILKACATNSRQRYQSAREMHGDLARLQQGKSIKLHHVWQTRLGGASRIGLATVSLSLAAALALFFWEMLGTPTGSVLPPSNKHGSAGTKNQKAEDAYNLGLPFLRRNTTDGYLYARDSFTSAIEADSGFVAAYARLFEVYLMSEDNGGVPGIDGKAQRLNEISAELVKLDRTNAETHAALAIVHFVNDWKWTEAEGEFQKALEADPNCRMALTYYGYFLTRLRRVDEANEVLQRALALDLTSPLITKFLGHCEFSRRRYQQALNLYLRATVLEPSYPSGHYWAGRAYLAMTNYSQALEEFERYMVKEGSARADTRFRQLREALKGGPRALWTKCIEIADRDDFGGEYMLAEYYARLGDRDGAMNSLQQAFTAHDCIDHLLTDEFWDEFRQEPRFRKVLEKVGLELWAR